MTRCQKCGKDLSQGARFCGACGQRLTDAAPQEDPAAAFEDNPTRAAPDAMRRVISQARHPTAVLEGVAQAAVELELARATAEFEDGGATRMDVGLPARLEQERDAPGDFEMDAPTRMVESSGAVPAHNVPVPKAAPFEEVPNTEPTSSADDFDESAPTRMVDSDALPPPPPARAVVTAPKAPVADLASVMEDAASGFGAHATGMVPIALPSTRPGVSTQPVAAPASNGSETPPRAAFPWGALLLTAVVVLAAGGAVLFLLGGPR